MCNIQLRKPSFLWGHGAASPTKNTGIFKWTKIARFKMGLVGVRCGIFEPRFHYCGLSLLLITKK